MMTFITSEFSTFFFFLTGSLIDMENPVYCMTYDPCPLHIQTDTLIATMDVMFHMRIYVYQHLSDSGTPVISDYCRSVVKSPSNPCPKYIYTTHNRDKLICVAVKIQLCH